MKMFRKLVSIVAAATLLTSSLAFSFSVGAAPVDEPVGSEPNLQENVQNGVILHAFNWSYNSIKENLPAIKAAGYSTVQTSPSRLQAIRLYRLHRFSSPKTTVCLPTLWVSGGSSISR